MEFIKTRPTSKAPAGWFTGDVWWDVIVAGQESSRMRANLVRFSPGARTDWHSHAVGQALHVVSGIALIGVRDGTVFEARPGETVSCPPGEEHWHGAEPVTDHQYNGPRTRNR
ncbi:MULTISPECIES: cupin domain-containing protein [Streptomyces]|uniref:Cupin domain-containing protein n=1 Tax=Streptomyces fimbriatus TaxID=68197 RepID=A0ABW0D4N8_STRFI